MGRHNKSLAVILGFTALLGCAIYPVIIHPKIFPEVYREKQKWLRNSVPLDKTQPGGMKVWSDPFERKKP